MQEVLGQLFGIFSRKARERISLVAFRIGTPTAYALTWPTHSPCTKGSFSQRKGSKFVVALSSLVRVMLRGYELLCTSGIGRMMIEVLDCLRKMIWVGFLL
jgi:hypothetical protein